MKKLLLLGLTVCILAIAVSCGENKTGKNTQPVELSFADFVLGGDFAKCIAQADTDSSLIKISQKEDNPFEYARYKTYIPDFSSIPTPVVEEDESDVSGKIPTDIEVYAYNGKVFKIELFSSSRKAKESFPEMYIAKYGNDDAIGDDHEWEFPNAKLFVDVKIHTNERKELDPSRHNLNLHNYENYYRTVYDRVYDGVNVTYLETNIFAEVEAYEANQKAIKDSLARVQKEEERLKKERERASAEQMKQENQQEILNNLRY